MTGNHAVLVGGNDITNQPPHKRNMGMVFQSYSLFPNLTVAENVAFGLRYKGLPKRDWIPGVRRSEAARRRYIPSRCRMAGPQ